jgi:hypothetical protein
MATDSTLILALPGGSTVAVPVIRHTFARWSGAPVVFDWGNKPIVEDDGEGVFAEIAIMRAMRGQGWDAVWTEAYGGFRCFDRMPASAKDRHTVLPPHIDAKRLAIWEAGRTWACVDVIAWRGDQILFIEAKRSKRDRPTKAQLKFIEAALGLGEFICVDRMDAG